jgi:hypothetical protein
MKLQSIDGPKAWAIVYYNSTQNVVFNSVTGIKYQLRSESNMLFYKGGNRNKGEEETISKDKFISAFDKIKSLDEINTNTIKSIVPNSLYRKRTPFIGMLFSSEVLS